MQEQNRNLEKNPQPKQVCTLNMPVQTSRLLKVAIVEKNELYKIKQRVNSVARIKTGQIPVKEKVLKKANIP